MGGVHVSGGMRAGYGGSRGVAHSPSSFARYPQRNFSRGVYAHNGFHGNPYRHAHHNHNHVYFYGIRNNTIPPGGGIRVRRMTRITSASDRSRTR